MKVLVVDQDPSTRGMVQRIVKRDLQGTVTEAGDAFDALELLEKQTFHVAMISLDIRDMTGTRLLELMRTVPRTARLPVIMISSRIDEATIRTLAQLGVAGVLAKPIDPALLSRRLQRFAQAAGAHALGMAPGTDLHTLNDTVLVVDGDAHFRHFAADALRGGRRILQVTTGAAALKSALAERPGLAIIGQGLGLLDGPLLIREMRSIPALASLRIVKLSADPNETETPDGFDGVVHRTFVPDVFRREVGVYSGPLGPMMRFMAAYPALMKDVSTGVELVCGMMLGIAVTPVKKAEAVVGSSVRSVQIVTAVDRGLSLRFEIEGSLADAISMTSQLASMAPEDVTHEDACATMAEMANIVTERLRNSLGESGIVLNCSLPSTRVADTGLAIEPQNETRHLHFATADGTLTLHVVVEAALRPEDLASAA